MKHGEYMLQFIPDFIRHTFPGMPGGPMTVLEMFAMMLILLILWRHTKWAGWLSFLLAALFYAVPVLIEYYH